jgi:hypothetical protein
MERQQKLAHGGRLRELNHLLQHTLRSLCIDSQWVYAVFWRILPRNYPPPQYVHTITRHWSSSHVQCRKLSSKFASRFPADQTRSAITCTWCTPHTTAPEFFISWTVPDLFWKLHELVLLFCYENCKMQIGFILSPRELLGWSAGMCIWWFVNVGFHRWESESEAMDRSRGNKRNWYIYHHSTLVEKERIS